MQTQTPWLLELLAVAAASPLTAQLPHFEVAFISSGRSCGFAVSPVRLTDGVAASCWIEGQDAAFEAIISGELTPQKAFLREMITMRGDPQVLLRVTGLFEVCAQSHRQ